MCRRSLPMLLCLVFVLSGICFGNSQQDSTKKEVKPDFTGVDVLVETDWGTSDRTENVDVFIRTEPDGHIDIVMRKSNHQECIAELVPGVVVKIIDRKTKKVLKTFKK